jgi:TolB-like protein
MLSGIPPFPGESVDDVLQRHVRDTPPPLRGVPAFVSAAIARAMAKAPPNRHATAEAFAEALVTNRGAAWRSKVAPWRRLVIAGVPLVLAAGLAFPMLRARVRSAVPSAASVVAVLPLVPDAPDSALARLGRDLVVTLSANLDGVTEIRTIDALTILARLPSSGAFTHDEGVQLARQLGATSIVHGTIARAGSDISVDARMVAVDDGRVLTRATWSGGRNELASVTDSLTWVLLRGIWRTRAPPTPDIAALTTRSMPALRAFLEGEHAALESRWDAASRFYEEAIRADSTFWLALWRYAFARWWYLEAVDDEVIATIRRRRYALPERDRLVFDSWVTDTFSVALARSSEVTKRFPDYWPGWMQHADWLFHVGPVYGHDRAAGKAALARAVSLNPSLTPAWEHLYWASLPDDTATAASALDALTRLGFSRTSTIEFGYDVGRVYRFELGLRRSGRIDAARRDSIVVELATTARGRLGGGATWPPAQIALSGRVLQARPRREVARIHEAVLAEAWASRGAWDSATLIAERQSWRRDGGDPLHGYRMAALGAWLGALPADLPMRSRAPAAVASESRGANQMTRAELAWLDGLVAHAHRDRAALARARERLQATDTVSTELLDRTLGALEAELTGSRDLAARTLASTNWRNPDLLVPGYGAHPFVIAVSRLAAARWLMTEGALDEADHLLRWFEAPFALDGYRPARRVLGALAMLERARIATRQDRHDAARRAYAEFLQRYDMPARGHAALLDEARRGTR